MKLKNGLIGLGLGFICLGNLLLAVNGSRNPQISDEEVRRRAEQLGMVEHDAILTSDLENSQVEKEAEETGQEEDFKEGGSTENEDGDSRDQDLSQEENGQEQGNSREQNLSQEGTGQKQGNSQDTKVNTEKTSGKKKNQKDKEKTEKTEKTKKTEKNTQKTTQKTTQQESENENADTITVKIPSGMTAGEICKVLEKKKLIEKAEDFREYLVEKNIQHKIQAGTFEIPEGADYDEIISMIYRG